MFASFRRFTKKVQIAFHNGASLDPEPPIAMKDPNIRYRDIAEADAQLIWWIDQAGGLPGETL